MSQSRRPSPRGALLALAALVVGSLLVLGNPLTTAPAVAAALLAVHHHRGGATTGPRPSLRAEHGSILVEVMVGTMLLAMTTAAVLDGLDGAQKVGRQNKDRSTGATLVQQDLERMRAMPPSVLANLDQTRSVAVANVTYTVTSRTELVRDSSGLVSCTSEDEEAEYFKLTSTVSSPASTDEPVTGSSLLTPPPGIFGDDTGTAAVKITDRDGLPLTGVTVDLEGSSFLTATTNAAGCAIFAFIDAGEWTAEVDGGLITWSGEAPARSEVTVAAGKTSLTQIELDEPASLRASFVAPNGSPALWEEISVSNAKLPNGLRIFPDTTPATSTDATNLFPFHDGYGVYAGSCEANNPAVWDSDYFATSGFGFADLDPGDVLEPVTVQVPLLHVTAKRSNDTAFDRVRVYVQQIDDEDFDCEEVIYDSFEINGTYTSYTFDIPVPFGNYEVCAAVRASSNWRRKFTGTSGMPANRDFTEPPLEQSVTMNVPTSGSSGQCDP